jgi:hypothetical protein
MNRPVIDLHKWYEGHECRLRHTPNLAFLYLEDEGNITLTKNDTHPKTTKCHESEQQNMKLKCHEILNVIN